MTAYKRFAFGMALVWLGAGAGAADRVGPNGDGADRPHADGLSASVTRAIVRQVERDFAFCAGLDQTLRFDCYKYVFRLAAQTIDGNRAYRTASATFAGLDHQIGAMVKAHVDPSRLPRLRGFQIYRQIHANAHSEVTAGLSAALETAETQLRRAPEQVGAHYQWLAAAVSTSNAMLHADQAGLTR